jgi:hypothetical protein
MTAATATRNDVTFTDTTTLDGAITADLRRNHHYRIVQVIPYGTEVPPIGLGTFVIWQYEPAAAASAPGP